MKIEVPAEDVANPPSTICVTAEEIANGRRDNCRKCPVALALERYGWWADVARERIVIRQCVARATPQGPGVYRARQTDEINRWIRDFDAGRTVAPTTFTNLYWERL